MADISKITLPSGSSYDLKDAAARQDIESLQTTVNQLSSSKIYIGESQTAITDGQTIAEITVKKDGETSTVIPTAGQFVTYGKKEFVVGEDSTWHEFGDASGLGKLAYKNSATGNYTPAGTVSKPTFTGTQASITTSITPRGSVTINTGTTGTVNYTPSGSVSKPTFTGSSSTISVKGTPAGSVTISTGTGTTNYTPVGTISITPSVTVNTATVNSITAVGTLPSWTATVANETLTLGWNAGTLPTKGSNTTVATGIKSATATGSFSGTGTQLVATFTGAETSSTGSYTPAGSVSQPTFTGSGAVLNATFSGTNVSGTATYTPTGTISTPTFTGTEDAITVE